MVLTFFRPGRCGSHRTCTFQGSRTDAGASFDGSRAWGSEWGDCAAREAKRCLRVHPGTETAGLLPFGSDPVRLAPPQLETAFRLCRPERNSPDSRAKQGIVGADP